MAFATEITVPQSGRVTDGTASDVTVPERKKADGALVSVSMGVAGPVYRMTSAQRNSGVLPVHAPVRQRGKAVVIGAVSVLTSPLILHPGGFRLTQAPIHDDAAESDALEIRPFEPRRGAGHRSHDFLLVARACVRRRACRTRWKPDTGAGSLC
jgi:hypothetical protein